MQRELPLIVSPRSGWQRMVAEPPGDPSYLLWLRKPAFVALVFGCAIALMSSAALRFGLVLSTALCWSFIPFAQLIGLRCVTGGETSELTLSQRVDIFFAGHTPWLLWVAILGVMTAFMPTTKWIAIFIPWMLVSAAVALCWSLWIDFEFFRVVCGLSRVAAALRLTLLRIISWTLIVAVFAYGSFWPSVLEVTSP
jgi:hypothetical protein